MWLSRAVGRRVFREPALEVGDVGGIERMLLDLSDHGQEVVEGVDGL
jgi:hypothetical protein